MKHVLMLLAIVVWAKVEVLAQVYLETTRQHVATPADEVQTWCDPNTARSLTFDFESISGGSMLDVAAAKTIRYAINWPRYYCFQDYNSGSGTFPNINGYFSDTHTTCDDNDRMYNMVFGKLRTTQPRKDLAVLRQTGTYIYI